MPLDIQAWNERQGSYEGSHLYDDFSEYDDSGLRVRNPTTDPTQRNVVHNDTNNHTKFQKSVNLALCAHGYAIPEDTNPATKGKPLCLIILHLGLSCKRRGHYKSADISFSFHSTSTSVPQAPRVVNWCPFKKAQRTDFTIENTTNHHKYGMTVGAEAGGAKLDVPFEKGTETGREQRFFHNGSSRALSDYDKDRDYGVSWSFHQNESQNYGVDPDTWLAILVEPVCLTGKPQPFHGRLYIKARAGFVNDIIRKICSSPEQDDDVLFDPASELHTYHINSAVEEEVKTNLDALSRYKNDGHFTELMKKV